MIVLRAFAARRPHRLPRLPRRGSQGQRGDLLPGGEVLERRRGRGGTPSIHRGEVPKGSAEIFFREVKFWNDDEAEEAPPVFNIDGVNYLHVKVAGLFFVVTTMVNVSPSLLLELMRRIARVIKYYLGVLNEDSLRKNFILVYELLGTTASIFFNNICSFTWYVHVLVPMVCSLQIKW